MKEKLQQKLDELKQKVKEIPSKIKDLFVSHRDIVVIVVALAMVMGVLVATAAPLGGEQAAKDASVSLVDKESGQGYCSAIKITPKMLLTAAHCVMEPEKGKALAPMWFKDVGGVVKQADVVKLDRKVDIALLKTNSACPCAAIAEDVVQGEEVMVVGYPLSSQIQGLLVLTYGNYQGLYKNHEGVLAALFTTPATYGNSGGGVFNAKGELVGIVTGGHVVGGPMGLPMVVGHLMEGVPLGDIKSFVNAPL